MSYAVFAVLACVGMALAEIPLDYPEADYRTPYTSSYSYPLSTSYSSYSYPVSSYSSYSSYPAYNDGRIYSTSYYPASSYSYSSYSIGKHAGSHSPCAAPVPEIKPVTVQSQHPVPYTFGLPLTPKVLEHHSAPQMINYYAQPYVVKHHQSAVLHAYTQKPVIVDNYEHPQVHELEGPQAVIVEEVCPPGHGAAISPVSAHPCK
nr:PREDICTED: uncharacterized protein LOC109032309 [Bemisia tabaci]